MGINPSGQLRRHEALADRAFAAWASLVMFVDLNAGTWEPDPPDIDEAEQAMLAVAAGEVDEPTVAAWLREARPFRCHSIRGVANA